MDSQDNVCGNEPEIVTTKGSIHSSLPANGKPLVSGLKQAFSSSFVLTRWILPNPWLPCLLSIPLQVQDQQAQVKINTFSKMRSKSLVVIGVEIYDFPFIIGSFHLVWPLSSPILHHVSGESHAAWSRGGKQEGKRACWRACEMGRQAGGWYFMKGQLSQQFSQPPSLNQLRPSLTGEN